MPHFYLNWPHCNVGSVLKNNSLLFLLYSIVTVSIYMCVCVHNGFICLSMCDVHKLDKQHLTEIRTLLYLC